MTQAKNGEETWVTWKYESRLQDERGDELWSRIQQQRKEKEGVQ